LKAFHVEEAIFQGIARARFPASIASRRRLDGRQESAAAIADLSD
jgi:hypothetical protein